MTNRNRSRAIEDLDPDICEHIQSLGLEGPEEYRRWCSEHGFSRRLKKHWKQRCRERYAATRLRAESRLAQKKREQRRLVDVVAELAAGDMDAPVITQPHLQRLARLLNGPDQSEVAAEIDRAAFIELVRHLHRNRCRVFDASPVIASLGQAAGNTYLEALAAISARSSQWLKPVASWKPRSRNARRQFGSLLRHLFGAYQIPAFLDSVWFLGFHKKATQRRAWYTHIGQGFNVRQCDLPLPCTRRMAHCFMQAPCDLSVDEALLWGWTLGLGGDEALARRLMPTRIASDFRNAEFWSSVIRWLVRFPELPRAEIAPVIDFIEFHRFGQTACDVGQSDSESIRPALPGLTMKGRTPSSMLKAVHVWHRKLALDNSIQRKSWQSSGIAAMDWCEGQEGTLTWRRWRIRELLSSSALIAEGRRMRHCVATYSSACASGQSSIWTMEVENLTGREKCVTIEVRNRSRQICQVRGRSNRRSSDQCQRVLTRWAEASQLTVSQYAL